MGTVTDLVGGTGERRIGATLAAAARLAVVAGALLASTAARGDPVTWATAQAAELTKQGQGHAARGDRDLAARRFLDAIQFDATYGPAYLALGELYERGGDLRESERAYAMGLERVARFAEGRRARGRLLLRVGRTAEAIADLEAAVALLEGDLGALRELGQAYVKAGALPAALSVARQALVLAEAQRDAGALAEARVLGRALGALVGEADPVLAGMAGRGAVRRALAVRARRR